MNQEERYVYFNTFFLQLKIIYIKSNYRGVIGVCLSVSLFGYLLGFGEWGFSWISLFLGSIGCRLVLNFGGCVVHRQSKISKCFQSRGYFCCLVVGVARCFELVVSKKNQTVKGHTNQ